LIRNITLPSLGVVLMSANAVILCLALDFAIVCSLWEWAHVASNQRAQIWKATRRWWVLAFVCALLPWILLPHAPPLAPPQTAAARDDALENAEERLPDKKLDTREDGAKLETKVPVLNEIPFVDRLFRSQIAPESEIGETALQDPQDKREARDPAIWEGEMRERFAMLLQSGLISEAEHKKAELIMNLARAKSAGGSANAMSQLEWKAVMDLYQRALMRDKNLPKRVSIPNQSSPRFLIPTFRQTNEILSFPIILSSRARARPGGRGIFSTTRVQRLEIRAGS
jgi:hypothetical protein